MDGKSNWLWFVIPLGLVGLLIGEAFFPKLLLIVFVSFVVGLIIFGLIALGKWFGIALTALILTILGIAAVDAVATWWANWKSQWPTPEAPTAQAAWTFENVGVPTAIYLIVISIGYATIWVTDSKKLWAASISGFLNFLGALMLHQTHAWGTGLAVGFLGSLVSLLLKLLNKPSLKEGPLIVALMAIIFGFISLIITPIQAWFAMLIGYSSPIAGITFIAGSIAGSGFFSALKKLVEEG